ncbi:hypothetical protein [Bradyrhizobium sp. 6(2017)]|uniref:hypothetical protein n=1 Tax=Bradyrhizobium sp. 6(2017) TaxID=1197460 RepID=UPI0039C882C2
MVLGDIGEIVENAQLIFAGCGDRRFEHEMATREALTKQFGRTILLSRSFADLVEGDFGLERVGEYPVCSFNEPIELFAYHG